MEKKLEELADRIKLEKENAKLIAQYEAENIYKN